MYRNFCIYHRDIFPVRNYGSFQGHSVVWIVQQVPMILSVIGTVGNKNCMDCSGCSRLTVRWHFCLFHIRHPWLITIAMHVICFYFVEEKSAWVTVGYAKI